MVEKATYDNHLCQKGLTLKMGVPSSRPRLGTTLYGQGVRSGQQVFYSRDRDSGQLYMGRGSDPVSRFSIVATATRDNPILAGVRSGWEVFYRRDRDS